MPFQYEKDPASIYRRSFEIIRSEAHFSDVTPALERVLVRMIHACGLIDLPQFVEASEQAAEMGECALKNGAPILCDSNMLAAGITRSRLPCNNEVFCALTDERVPELSKRLNTTRTAAAIELWRDRLEGSVVAIANAPTALFHLLEMIASGAPKPALVLGLPVGFVGAAESKTALAENALGLSFITVRGRRGGSAIAAAAVNALAKEQA